MTLQPGRPANADPAPPIHRRNRARAAWDDKLRGPLDLSGHGAGAPEAWFLGPAPKTSPCCTSSSPPPSTATPNSAAASTPKTPPT